MTIYAINLHSHTTTNPQAVKHKCTTTPKILNLHPLTHQWSDIKLKKIRFGKKYRPYTPIRN